MYSKVINPQKDGKVQFENKGSVARLANYLEKELDTEKNPDGKIFFNAEGDFSKDEMIEVIDSNVKGLKASDDKFYSLVISPSQEELLHIGNDPQKLREFTMNCMENYASQFNLKDKAGEIKKVTEKDLRWFANIEYDRSYKGTDREVIEGVRKQGDKKEGLQTHIHITVSARDKDMKITLNPNTNNAARFSKLKWAETNQQIFNQQFGIEQSNPISFNNANRQAWNKIMSVEKQLERYEAKYGMNEADAIQLRRLAIEKEYSADFRQNLKALGKELRQGIGKGGLEPQQWENMVNSKKDESEKGVLISSNLIDTVEKSYHFFRGVEDVSPTETQELKEKLNTNLRKLKTKKHQQSPHQGLDL